MLSAELLSDLLLVHHLFSLFTVVDVLFVVHLHVHEGLAILLTGLLLLLDHHAVDDLLLDLLTASIIHGYLL